MFDIPTLTIKKIFRSIKYFILISGIAHSNGENVQLPIKNSERAPESDVWHLHRNYGLIQNVPPQKVPDESKLKQNQNEAIVCIYSNG